MRLIVPVLSIFAAGAAFAAGPPAPTLLSPAAGVTLQQPFVETWSAVTDAAGVFAYNWQVSPNSGFTIIVAQGSATGVTQATISGLLAGTYFFRVQGADNSFAQGAWSASRTFTVTGSGPAALPAPVLQPTRAYSTFHPYELEVFNWSTVPGAATYLLQFTLDPNFAIVPTANVDNLTNPTMSFQIANPEGNYLARVFAVDAKGVRSSPSNVIHFSVFYNNPIGPPPATVSPSADGVMTLPINLSWSDVPNPQPNGYEFQIATDSAFKNIEVDYPQDNDPFFVETSLSPGPKFWRVRSVQGDATPETAAVTAWSPVGTFTVSTAPATPISLSNANPNLFSGDITGLAIQLSAGIPGTANMTMTSSNPAAFPVPPTVQFGGNLAVGGFQVQVGTVTTPTQVTVTGTLNGHSASTTFTINPQSLKEFNFTPTTFGGGMQGLTGTVMMNGAAPPAGAVISLSSNSPAVTVAPTATLSPGFYWANFAFSTNNVMVKTIATITATFQGSSISILVTVLPPAPPAAITLSPATTAGGSGTSVATVTLGAPAAVDDALQITVSNPSIVSVPTTVVIPAGYTTGSFTISTSIVSASTNVGIAVSGGGATVSAVLTVTPAAQVAVLALNLAPGSVTGGSASIGTVTLASAAGSGGALVILSSNSASASVPTSIAIPAGATSGTFAISTSAVSASITATITASGGGVARSAALTVNPAPTTATATIVTSGRSGVNVISSPSGISVPTGSTGQGTFNVGTALTLSVTSGRDAIWSGACSSGGSKMKTCSFTLNTSGTVNVSVQ
jgi:hypothetical protein